MLRFVLNVEHTPAGWNGRIHLSLDGETHSGSIKDATEEELVEALRAAGKYAETMWPEASPPAEIRTLLAAIEQAA